MPVKKRSPLSDGEKSFVGVIGMIDSTLTCISELTAFAYVNNTNSLKKSNLDQAAAAATRGLHSSRSAI